MSLGSYDIGDRIKKIRGKLRQDEFAKKMGVHSNTIGRWERAERTPDYTDLNKILAVFPEISPTWLLSGEGSMKLGEIELEEKEFKSRRKAYYAERFRLMRGDRSIEEFCKDVGEFPSSWWELEENLRDPSGYRLSIICDKLGINPAWLIDNEGPMLKADIRGDQINTALLYDVIKEVELHDSINPGSLSLDKKAELMAELYAMRAAKGQK